MHTQVKFTVRPESPVPAYKTRKKAPYRLALEAMSVGQSILFEPDQDRIKKCKDAVYVTIKKISKESGKKFAARSAPNSFAVWRVA